MLLNRLRLAHFRTYDSLDLRLSPGVTLLCGSNGAGKTNVLEAVLVLATTKSFRTRTDRELISWTAPDESVPRYARLEGDAHANGGPVRVDMAIAEQPARLNGGDPTVRKQFKVNGSSKRASDVVGEIKAVLFSPDDVTLVTGSPSQRRRFMDLTLCQVDHHYLRMLQEYARVLVQRNSLLQRLRGRPDPATLLEFWDEKVIAAGAHIMSSRKTMLRVLNDFAREAYADIAGSGEELEIVYRPSLEEAAEASENKLDEILRRRLTQLQSKEIYQGMTLCGPHRDDLQFLVRGADAQYFGSRGQQRSIALSLRLSELRYMTNRTGEQPVLLLDEAMAELDEERRGLLLRLMDSHPQVIATTSNLDVFPEEFRRRATVLNVSPGRIAVTAPVQARAS
jgi:DNA replication and repair protein RecF